MPERVQEFYHRWLSPSKKNTKAPRLGPRGSGLSPSSPVEAYLGPVAGSTSTSRDVRASMVRKPREYTLRRLITRAASSP